LACSHTVSICQAACSFTHPTPICFQNCSFTVTTICHTACSNPISPRCEELCSFALTVCQAGCTFHIPSIQGPVGPEDPVERLAAVRAQLEAALAQVKEQEEAQAEAMAPQTVEQVDLLVTKLQEALTALEARRAQLQQKSGEGSS
jgi:hypothetical protein